jgi:hypothetical protein
MLDALASAIRDQVDEVTEIFETGFQRPQQWIKYIHKSFGTPPDVDSLINTAARWGDKNQSLKSFQALFVACWICYPVEKGSYMIHLPGNQNIPNGHNTLDTRWSSHVSEKNARNASAGFEFLQGYRELLVQIEGDFLFLKAEGHSSMSLKHMASYVNKVRTGAGKTASPALNNFARQYPNLIAERAAENYGTAYEALLKKLKLTGKEIDVRTATDKMIKKCRKDDLTTFRALLVQAGLPPDTTDTQRYTNRAIGHLLTEVIIPFAKGLSDKSKFGKQVQSAEDDLLGIAAKLWEDKGMWGFNTTPRLFQELRLRPDVITTGLQAFVDVVGNKANV